MDGLHLAVLWAFAVAQPYFGVVRDSPAFFAVRGSEPVDIVVLAVGLVVLPPLALVGLEALAGLVSARLRWALHLGLVGLLAAAVLVPVLERITGRSQGALMLPLAALLGAGAAVAYARHEAVRSTLTVLSPAPLVFLVLFLLFSPVTKLVTGGEADAELAQVRSSTPVAFVVFDELPLTSLLGADGRFDAERYPNFAALARRSDWYRDTATVDSGTEHAVPAILDGRWPRAHDVPTLADHPHNLFTLLGRSHRVNAGEVITRMCPENVCGSREQENLGGRLRSLVSDSGVVVAHLLLPDDLRDGLPSISGRWQGFGDDVDPVGNGATDAAGGAGSGKAASFGRFGAAEHEDRSAAVRTFLRGIHPVAPGQRPPMHFLHVLLPHQPWQYLPSGRQYGDVTSGLGRTLDRWSSDPLGPVLHYQRHLLQAQYADRMLGDVLRRLREAGLFERSLVLVAADHGISFRRGQAPRVVSPATAGDIAPVPLLVKAPGQRAPRVHDVQIRTIDILPTIADHLGVRIPWPVDGRTARGATEDRRVVLHDAGGHAQPFTARWLRAHRAEALRRQLRLFGAGDDRPGLLGIGPHPELVGRSVAGIPLRRSSLRASIDQTPDLQAVDKGSGFVPTHLTGSVSGPGANPSLDLALAVNGRIAAVGRPLRGAGDEFAMMISESALHDGSNRVQVLAVRSASGPVLTLLGQAGEAQRDLVLDRGVIRASKRRPIAIGERIRGEVRESRRVGPVVRLSGWALDTRTRRPVQTILAFAGRRLVAVTRPRELDPRAATLLGVPPFDLGWQAEIPEERLGGAGDLRLFGVAGAAASALPFSCPGDRAPAPGCPRLRLGQRAIGVRPGRPLRITDGGVQGVVDLARVDGPSLLVQGWAVRSRDHRPVDRVIAFAGDRLLFSAPPEVKRPDVASRFAVSPEQLGFSLRVPRRLVAGVDDRPQVFGVADGVAVRLPMTCDGEAGANLGC